MIQSLGIYYFAGGDMFSIFCGEQILSSIKTRHLKSELVAFEEAQA